MNAKICFAREKKEDVKQNQEYLFNLYSFLYLEMNLFHGASNAFIAITSLPRPVLDIIVERSLTCFHLTICQRWLLRFGDGR